MTRVVIVLALATLLFGMYIGFFRKSETFVMDVPQFEQSEQHPAYTEPPKLYRPPPPQPTPIPLPSPTASDPLASTQRESNFQDEKRAPENLFRPAPRQTNTELSEESGMASSQIAANPAIDTFGPETAQNGGDVLGNGIFAFDKDDEGVKFSAF